MTVVTLDFPSIRAGDVLPPLVVDVTATRIVAGAIATRDFMPAHHDRSLQPMPRVHPTSS